MDRSTKTTEGSPARSPVSGRRSVVVASLALVCLLASTGALTQNAPAGPAAKPNSQAKPAPKRGAEQAPGKARDAKPASRDAKEGEQGKVAEGEQKSEKEEPKSKPAERLTVSVGWAEWNLLGNAHKFRQYATPPDGVFLDLLRYTPALRRNLHNGLFTIKGLGEPDHREEARLDLFHGITRFEGFLTRNSFFDTTPVVVDASGRLVQEAAFKQLITPGFAIAARYRMDEQNQAFEAPRSPLHQRTRTSDIVAEGRLGNGFLSVGFTDWRFFDRTSALPDDKIERLHASYLWEILSFLGIEVDYTRQSISQPGRPKSAIEAVGVAGDIAVGSATDLDFQLRRERRDLATTKNGYLREVRNGGVSLTHRWQKWNVNISLRSREAERVRGDQTFVDVPKWWIFEGRLSGRLSRQTKFTLRGYTQSLSQAPPSVLTDPRPLFWDNRAFAQAKLETGTPIINGYLIGGFRRLDNAARKVTVENRSVQLGGNWQIDERLSAFAEANFDTWNARSEISAVPLLDEFAPDSQTTVVGLGWAIDSRTYFSATLTEFASSNNNPLLLRDGNAHGSFLTINLQRHFPAGYDLGLIVAPWRYRDRVVDLMNYDATVVMVTASARF